MSNLTKDNKLVFEIMAVIDPTSKRKSIYVDNKGLSAQTATQLLGNPLTGFQWGYNGDGCSITALTVCLEIFTSVDLALRLYKAFRVVFVTQWPDGMSFIRNVDLSAFLATERVKSLIAEAQAEEIARSVWAQES